MGWFIYDDAQEFGETIGVRLPFGGPQKVSRRVMRKQAANKILSAFPLPFDLGPDSFALQLTGLISPPKAADKLYELAKRAEVESITITVKDDSFGDDATHFNKINGQYAVSRGNLSITKPQFDENGKLVQKYDITFIQFAEQSDVGNGDSGDIVNDEPGIGFGDINFSFGDIILDTFGNLFPNFLT